MGEGLLRSQTGTADRVLLVALDEPLTSEEEVDDPSQSARAFYVSSPEPKD